MQLDLFMSREATKPAAVIFRFPLHRRADLVRQTAAELRSRTYAGGKRYWGAHVQQIRRQLRASGLSRTDTDAEIRDYARAVRVECLSSRPLREVSR